MLQLQIWKLNNKYRKFPNKRHKMIVDDTSKQRELVEGVEQVVERIQEENQQDTTTPLQGDIGKAS